MDCDKILNGNSLGLWVNLNSPLLLEALLEDNVYDWIAIDLEHSAFSDRDIETLFIVCDKCKVIPFVRLSGNDPLQGRRMLDFGARGIIIPGVESGEDLDRLTDHFFYPPRGKRGVCLSRMNQFGETFKDYHSSFLPIIIPQIETAAGCENIDEIAGKDYVFSLMVGMYDLSASLGVAGDFASKPFKAAIEQIAAGIKKNNKVLGYHIVHPNIDELLSKRKQGYKFLAYGTDVLLAKYALKELKNL